MDVKFIRQDIYEGTVVKIVQAKLFKIEDYYRNAMDTDDKKAQNQLSHMKILEIESMNYKLNLTNKGGNSILSDYSSNGYKRHACKLEFVTSRENENSLIVRYDNRGKLCIVAMNSFHIFYCQCFFYSTETNTGYQVKLFNLVRPNDHPVFDVNGKTSLWIDDIQWAPNDLT